MKSTQQAEFTSDIKSHASIMLDPIAWLAAFEAGRQPDLSAVLVGEEILRRNQWNLELALAKETDLRAELIIAYLLGSPNIRGVARKIVVEVNAMLESVDACRQSQH